MLMMLMMDLAATVTVTEMGHANANSKREEAGDRCRGCEQQENCRGASLAQLFAHTGPCRVRGRRMDGWAASSNSPGRAGAGAVSVGRASATG